MRARLSSISGKAETNPVLAHQPASGGVAKSAATPPDIETKPEQKERNKNSKAPKKPVDNGTPKPIGSDLPSLLSLVAGVEDKRTESPEKQARSQPKRIAAAAKQKKSLDTGLSTLPEPPPPKPLKIIRRRKTEEPKIIITEPKPLPASIFSSVERNAEESEET